MNYKSQFFKISRVPVEDLIKDPEIKILKYRVCKRVLQVFLGEYWKTIKLVISKIEKTGNYTILEEKYKYKVVFNEENKRFDC